MTQASLALLSIGLAFGEPKVRLAVLSNATSSLLNSSIVLRSITWTVLALIINTHVSAEGSSGLPVHNISISSGYGLMLRHVVNNNALAGAKASELFLVRDGFASPGDGGRAFYSYSPKPCIISGGDGGSEVPSADGGCWDADFGDSPPSIKIWGVVADSNGTTGSGKDNTVAMQAAIDWVKRRNRKIYAPGGVDKYRFTGRLTLDGNGTIEGDGADPGSRKGTWFFFDHTDYGLLSAGTWHYKDFGTLRAQPKPAPSASTVYHPCACNFDIDSVGGELYINNVFTLNPTKQLDAQAGRLVVDGLRGQPLSIGIQLEDVEDTASINHWRAWPYWTLNPSVMNYTRSNRDDIVLERVDNPEFVDTFGYASANCAVFASGHKGITSRAAFVNFGCDDYGRNGILYKRVSGTSAMFSNAYVFPDTTAMGCGVVMESESSYNALTLNNFRSSNPYAPSGGPAFKIGGTGDEVTATNLQVDGWGGVSGTPAISVVKGSSFNLNDLLPNIKRASDASPWFGGTAYIAPSEGLVEITQKSGVLAISSSAADQYAYFSLSGSTAMILSIPPDSPFVALSSEDGRSSATRENIARTPFGKISVGYYADQNPSGYYVYNNRRGEVNLVFRVVALGSNR